MNNDDQNTEIAALKTRVAELETELQMQRWDDYFGLCPHCHQNDGYLSIGRDHWFFCDKHRTTWWGGSNMLSSWREETEQEQREKFEAKMFDTYKKVEPYFYPRQPDSSYGSTECAAGYDISDEKDFIPF
jgi:hypothetical protein